MRLYITQFQGAGTADDPFRSVLADRGYRCRRVADLRSGRNQSSGWAMWLCWTDDTQHAQALRTPGVVYLPFEDARGNYLRPSATLAEISADNRTAILGVLRQRGIPTEGLTANSTIREIVQRFSDRGQIAGWLGADNLPDDLTARLSTLSVAQRTKLRSRLEEIGYTVRLTAATTVESLLSDLNQQARTPRVRDDVL